MTQAVVYSASEDRMLDSEQDAEIDGVDPWKAAMQGDLDALLQYIDDNGDVNQRDRDNNTPLHWACQESHFDIVGVLMSRNAAVDPVNDLQSTPLHYACREGNLDIVTGLINFNANLEARNKDNLSPLHVAAGMGHIEVTKRLLDNRAHMEAEDNALYTPLWRAAYYGHPEVVEVLLLKGANKLARNKKGRKPGDVFSPSVEEENKERIKAMLGMGGDSIGTVGERSRVDPSRPGGVVNRPPPPGTDVSEPSAPTKPLPSDRRPPVRSAHSQAESYAYPDPSPANSPNSNLPSNTITSDPLFRVPVVGTMGKTSGVNGSLVATTAEDVTMETGIQTTPSVNGVEIERLKTELAAKNKKLQQLGAEVEEYKDNLHKAQTDNSRELDSADEQAEKLKRRVAQAESELEMKKGEVGQARREIEVAARSAEERIAQLEQELQMARSKSCTCTIS